MRARAALSAALLAGCTAASGPPPVTRLELHAVPTLVEECGALTSWSVQVVETGERYTTTCDQGIVVGELQPYQPYTLDLSGYAGSELCWRGKCPVTPLPGLDVAECPHAVTDVCADAGP